MRVFKGIIVKRVKLFVLLVMAWSFIVTTQGALAQITIQLPGFKSKSSKPRKSRVKPRTPTVSDNQANCHGAA